MAAFLALVFLFLISCEPNRLDVVEVWDNGAPREAWDVSPDGNAETWFSWYRNGIKAEELPFSKGLPNGIYRKWSVTGFIMETGAYKDSLREGKWTFFARERVPYMQGFYEKGLKHGKWILFDEDGKIAGEQFFRNDTATGVWKKFHKDVLIEENSCHEANEAGYFRAYSNEGKISIYQKCRHGKPNGVFTSYYPGGSLHKVGYFENGLKNGLWVDYFANGNLRKIEHWMSSMRNGEWVRYGEAGEVVAKTEFIDGTGIFEDTSWQNNRISEVRIALKGGEYSRVEVWENGAKRSTADYRKGSSRPSTLGFWKNGKKDSVWRAWYKNGLLKDSLNFKDGEQAGEQFYYDSTGRLYKKELIQGIGAKVVEMF